MKAMRKYESELKKLLSTAKKTKPSAPDTRPAAVQLVKAILEADATPPQAEAALTAIDREFVDYNELRASPVKDISEIVGKSTPDIRTKADTIVRVLNRIFDKHYSLSLEYMDKMPKRDLRRHLLELGLDNYASAQMMLTMFDAHAIPVDRSLVQVLEINQLVPPGSNVEQVQKTLERMVAHKDALATHEFLRGYVAKNADALAKYRKEQAEAAAAAAPKPEPAPAASPAQQPGQQADQAPAQKPAPAKKAAKARTAKAPAAKTAAKPSSAKAKPKKAPAKRAAARKTKK